MGGAESDSRLQALAKSSGRFAADREIFATQASCPQLS
jgi:hypothetical protein